MTFDELEYVRSPNVHPAVFDFVHAWNVPDIGGEVFGEHVNVPVAVEVRGDIVTALVEEHDHRSGHFVVVVVWYCARK